MNIKSKAQEFLSDYEKKNPATFAAAEQAIGGLLILDGLIGIDNPFGGKKRPGIIGSLVGVLLGIAFIFLSSFIGNLSVNKLTAITNATVVSVSQPVYSNINNNRNSSPTCTLEASYTVNDKEYTQSSSDSASDYCSLTTGQTIQINYDPNSPGSWSHDVGTVKVILRVFLLIGILVVVVGLITFVIRLLSIIFGWKLLKNGRALAKTLPEGTDLSTIKNEIKQNFSKIFFGTGGGISTLLK